LRARGLDASLSPGDVEWWCGALFDWEGATAGFLPVRALREAAGLRHDAMTLVFAAGVLEEDARFGTLFEALHGAPGQARPTLGLLEECWSEAGDRASVRRDLRKVQALGLLCTRAAPGPRAHQAVEVPHALWDVLRGGATESPVPWARYRAPADLFPYEQLITSGDISPALASAPRVLEAGGAHTVILRGPRQNGRRTTLGAVARATGRGVLEIDGFTKPDDDRWSVLWLLATTMQAMPVVTFDLGPGEVISVARGDAYQGPIGFALGKQGAITGTATESALTFTIDAPDAGCRPDSGADVDVLAERFRMSGGHIRRAAGLARAHAALGDRRAISPGDVRQANRALHRQVLETLATPVAAAGDWTHLGTRDDTLRELTGLAVRCRHRERLRTVMRDVPELHATCGVRALFRGPSGTGKTLAARLLASALELDLYRLDLSTIVNKYIGETEKNLERVLSRAEELDVILLLDEGDALLTQRTSVQTSNDRYANLETNYLLQRLESFEGILIVTTNAGERIDAAFERRMDVVIDFRPPEPSERWDIWQIHLPRAHAVDPDVLGEVATRCALSGGQIRNAVLHASLLAVEMGGVITSELIEAAVQREYRKIGAVCPLRRALAGARE
jgi:ATPase family protein associated with various cellular activities (AAA)